MLASMVSSQIIGDPRSGNESLSAPPVDAPPGWQAVGQELSQRIANCESLLRRNAFYSARQEAEEAALDLVRVLDLMANQYSCEPAWQSAMKAVSEAEDFSNIQRLTTDSDFLSRVIQSHETTVLKGYDVSQISPLVAAQHYRLFAQNQLREASLGHPWASEIFFALGRTYQAQADSEVSDAKELFHWRAVTLFRAAYDINPNNSIAANQLGYLYLQMDRAEDARSYLIASLNASPSIAAYENLIESSRRLGDQNTQQWALNQRAALSHGQMRAEGQPPAVVELDPRTFAAISPYTSGPQPYAARGSQPAPRMASLPSGQNNF
jgi:tetratricopeptide (TPR) repeat protein